MPRHFAALVALLLLALPATAQEVRITPDIAKIDTIVRGQRVTIERNQDNNHRLTGGFTRTSRPCPPFCIHPMKAAPGVETVGEVEVMDFLQQVAAEGRGLLVDARIPDFYVAGTIPGAVNVPFTTVADNNPFRFDIIQALGAQETSTGWDFSSALELLVFCNGPWCDQSPTMIRNLIGMGYPPEKLHYYRGGMQNWLMLGLSVQVPGSG